jgi:hypothetical protein
MNGTIVQTAEKARTKAAIAMLSKIKAEEIENLRACYEDGAYNTEALETIEYLLKLLEQQSETTIQLKLF